MANASYEIQGHCRIGTDQLKDSLLGNRHGFARFSTCKAAQHTRQERLGQLKQAIAAGKYHVPAEQLAHTLLQCSELSFQQNGRTLIETAEDSRSAVIIPKEN